MEDDNAPPQNPAPGILSALDSPRSGSFQPRSRPRVGGRSHSQRGWPLWLLMLGGAACASVGLWLGLQPEPHESFQPPLAAPAQPQPLPVQPATPTALVATQVAPHAPTPASGPSLQPAPAPPPLAALIEDTQAPVAAALPGASAPQPGSMPGNHQGNHQGQQPSSTSAQAMSQDSAAPTSAGAETVAGPASSPRGKGHSPLAALAVTPRTSPSKDAERAIARKTTPRQARASKPPSARSPSAPRGRRQSDDDVALLEAMFAHTNARKPPRSAVQELERRCGPLSGAEAKACRVKVCKQFPDARVCG